jgi:hypothetical protein
VVNGRVYVGTRQSLVVYGLLPAVMPTFGNQQSATVATTLPVPLQVTAADPYTGVPTANATVTFSDGGKGGTFTSLTAITDTNGHASTNYTLPTKAARYVISASSPGFATGSLTETATAASPAALNRSSGNNQTTPILTTFPTALGVKAVDKYGNGVSGVVVTFSDHGLNGSFSPNPVTTNSSGVAATRYTCSSKAGSITLYATATGLNAMNFSETVAAGLATSISVVSGSNQTGTRSTVLAQPLVVKVTDVYGNPVSSNSVTFSDGGAGGSFSANPVSTGSIGTASLSYTAGPSAGTVKITATAVGVSTATVFTETVQ